MTAEQIAVLLAGAPLFAGLDPELVLRVARYGDEARFAGDALLARDGWPADRFFVLLEGSVALETRCADRAPLRVETLAAPETVGWSWLMPPYHWHFDVRALTPLRTVAIEAEALRVAMAADPVFAGALLEPFAVVILRRLQSTRLRLLEAASHPSTGP